MMLAIGEFRGINHVTIHLPGDDDGPLCDAPREPENDLYGPHEMTVTPDHTDVCDDCADLYKGGSR